jgi:hypothetical protein
LLSGIGVDWKSYQASYREYLMDYGGFAIIGIKMDYEDANNREPR